MVRPDVARAFAAAGPRPVELPVAPLSDDGARAAELPVTPPSHRTRVAADLPDVPPSHRARVAADLPDVPPSHRARVAADLPDVPPSHRTRVAADLPDVPPIHRTRVAADLPDVPPSHRARVAADLPDVPPSHQARVAAIARLRERPTVAGVEALRTALGVDEVIVAAVALDLGTLTYAATRRGAGCGTETLTSTRAGELVERLSVATCVAGEGLTLLEAPAIAHPRLAPSSVTNGSGTVERHPRAWRKPWLWVGVVGAVGLGVVLAVNLWPRDATYAATLDFHQFAVTSMRQR